MENRRSLDLSQDRRARRSSLGLSWLSHHSPLTLGLDFSRAEKPIGVELLSVAHTTMSWWEAHKDDTIIEDGRRILRYPCKPSFISHAEEILKKAFA